MITDEIMEAIDLLIASCSSEEQRKGMESVKEMLGDFDEWRWIARSEKENCEWIEQFLNCDPNI